MMPGEKRCCLVIVVAVYNLSWVATYHSRMIDNGTGDCEPMRKGLFDVKKNPTLLSVATSVQRRSGGEKPCHEIRRSDVVPMGSIIE
jgi:hypothetical protein